MFGQRWIRDELCAEALRLGRVLAALAAQRTRGAFALVALMEFQSSRFARAHHADGTPILLAEPGPHELGPRPDHRGTAALARADALGRGRGTYGLQAALAECHATAATAETPTGTRSSQLYDTLGRLAPSPVVALNRPIAVSMATGPAEALQIIDSLTGLDNSYLRPSVRGELLARLGRHDEAAREFEAAAALTGNDRERDVLLKKARGAGL